MSWIRTLLKVKPGRRVAFTLDSEGGLVVNRRVLVNSKVMERQFKAARELQKDLLGAKIDKTSALQVLSQIEKRSPSRTDD